MEIACNTHKNSCLHTQQCFSFWGTSPRLPPGLCPWTPLRNFCPQDTLTSRPLIWNTEYGPGTSCFLFVSFFNFLFWPRACCPSSFSGTLCITVYHMNTARYTINFVVYASNRIIHSVHYNPTGDTEYAATICTQINNIRNVRGHKTRSVHQYRNPK